MRDTRQIYSLNLIAYLKMLGLDYELENEGSTLFYAVFNNDIELEDAIQDYKQDRTLQDFLNAFRELREEINTIRNGK